VHCSGLENPVNISALDSVLLKIQMMLTASRGHESATACETEEDRFIWTSGGSAEFEAVSFACGKMVNTMSSQRPSGSLRPARCWSSGPDF
jgi:hypothetical protein